jgi:FkbM family methyltransferase
MAFISYAQNFEDVMLWRALRGVGRGFYIDAGAADPVEMSVTKAFYDAGWRGVNIEPGRQYFERLQAARPADVNLNLALASAPGTRVFHEIADTGLSTLDQDIAAAHGESGWTSKAREVQAMTLAELCEVHAPGDIHFLKIDVEGAEGEVLAGADFQAYRPWIVLLEATRPMTTVTAIGWEPLILNAGYVFVWFDGLNRFYVAKERHAELQRHFQVPPNPFDNFIAYDAEAATRSDEQRQLLAAAERRLQEQAAIIKRLEAEILPLRDRQTRLDARYAALEEAQSHLTREAAALRRDLDDAQRDLRHAQAHAAALEPYRRDLEHLVFKLRWDNGPRALKLVLPLARGLRRLTRKH